MGQTTSNVSNTQPSVLKLKGKDVLHTQEPGMPLACAKKTVSNTVSRFKLDTLSALLIKNPDVVNITIDTTQPIMISPLSNTGLTVGSILTGAEGFGIGCELPAGRHTIEWALRDLFALRSTASDSTVTITLNITSDDDKLCVTGVRSS